MVNFKARTNDAEEGKSKWLGDLDLTLFLPTVFMVLFSLAEFGLLNHFNLIELGWTHWRVGAIFTVIILVFLFKKAHGGYEEAVFTVLISLVFPWVLGVLYLIGLSIFLWHLPTLKDIDFAQLAFLQALFLALGLVMACRQ
ncbi:hypothetical protein [Buttiauxella gaviniae]|uniref:hypothetical protein n=1 Tax=Buttiauxella gaviniae TaxID=82990 RepID=UPI0039AF32AE